MQTREHAGACGRRRRTAAAGRARTGRTSRPGMSLLELLMVVTIIAILAALLIPGSRHAWANYQATKCKVNLNTLYKALYASSHTLPSATGWTTTVHAAGAANALICPVDTIEVTPDDVFIYDPNKHTDMVFGPDGESTIMQPAQNVTQSNKMTIRDEVPESCVFGNKGFAQPSGMESNSSIFMFTEREDYVLPEDVPVDIGEPGYYTRNYSSTGTTIPSGTPVNCYFLHYDSKENQSAQVYGASLTFRREILGVICLSSTLDATDETLGVTEYDKGRRARGYENNAERVTLSDDRKTFTMNQYKISFPGEDCRVITKAFT